MRQFAWAKRIALVQVALMIVVVIAIGAHRAALPPEAWLFYASIALLPWLATAFGERLSGSNSDAGSVFAALDVIAVAVFAWVTVEVAMSGPNMMSPLMVAVVAAGQTAAFALLLVAVGMLQVWRHAWRTRPGPSTPPR